MTMTFTLWFVIVGLLLVTIAIARPTITRLPLSTPLLYLAIGIVLGPQVIGFIDLDPFGDAGLIERVTEIAVVVSLFTAGLKLRVPLRDRLWRIPVLLAFLSMMLTVGLIAAVGHYALGMAVGVAVLFGAVLAPTDPVLAAEVQVTHLRDRDPIRFSLTGEAGLNDGTAFPFVMLGLGLIGLHEMGLGWRTWWLIDVVWAIPGGLLIGGLVGTLVGSLVLYLRRQHGEALGGEEFLTIGVIALAYGVALLLDTYGFLAVFAAGVAMRRIESRTSGEERDPEEVVEEVVASESEGEPATHAEAAPAHLTRSVLAFNEQLERLGEVVVLLLVGAMITTRYVPMVALWFVPLLFLVIRPLAAAVALAGSETTWVQRGFISLFGVRGIGSIYYLMYAIVHGLEADIARELTGLTLTVVATSVVIHGITVSPLMAWYNRQGTGPKPATTMPSDPT